MATGLLRLTGSIGIGQFWPNGGSDADTIKVDIKPGAFAFRPHPAARFAATTVFDRASVSGKSGRKPVVDKNNRVIIRLQGIDAPELHYPGMLSTKLAKLTPAQRAAWDALDTTDYRQAYGESATVALGKRLARLAGGKTVVPCQVTTAVDHPNEVLDTYGRFIGDVLVTVGAKPANVNLWLAEQGWAFPTFYTSMSAAEIASYGGSAKTARAKKLGVWKDLSLKLGTAKLRYRKKPMGQPDAGPVILPKLFRRLVVWTLDTAVGLTGDPLKAFLHGLNPRDSCYLTTEFVKFGIHSAAVTQHFLDEFVSNAGAISFQPDELVFAEKPSTLLDANGKPVAGW